MSATETRIPVTLIPGDGIGPECVTAARRIVEAAGAPIDWEEAEAGAEVFSKGLASGVPPETRSIRSRGRASRSRARSRPRSASARRARTSRSASSSRPTRTSARCARCPASTTPYSGRGIDLVMVRENVEDLYAGIEYMQTPGRRPGAEADQRARAREKIARFAFEYARSEGRTTVACATKANIMKFTEGTLKRVFEQVAPDYPDIESWHVIVDNCAHQLVKRPEQFDVIVTTNMNGDILSDLSSALDRRTRLRAEREHRQRGRDLRGRARLGAEVRRQERDQPDRA